MATEPGPATLDADVTLASLTLAEKVALLAGRGLWSLNGVARLGIPSIVVSDGPHGLRKERAAEGVSLVDTVPATCFPTASALAATWNTALVEEVGAAIGREAAAEGVSVVLGPGANIKRTPLCGRSFEYFSEDPLLSGRLAAAWIRGAQGAGVGASLKHFAANNQETRRFVVDARVDERALREIYLASFERAVVEGRPWTVMAAYNRLNGTWCTEHRELLTGILRDGWGFDGVVISDWGAVDRRASAVDAGLDLEMPGFGGGDAELLRAVADGRLAGEAVDAAARRILALVARTARAREPGRAYDPDAHHELSRRAAAEAVVLLKNDGGILPLAAEARVAIVGAFAKEPRFQGGGSSMIAPRRVDDAWSELQALVGDDRLRYAPGYRRDTGDTDETLLAEARAAALQADVVVAFVGLAERLETEGVDRIDLRLPPGHGALVEALADACPRVVVVLATGAPVEMPWADRVAGIVEGYLGGQAGGSALARVLVGAAEPGGRLAETFPLRLEDVPVHVVPAGPRLVEYRESVYVGYRYHDSAGVDVRFPFGHGLGYTTFAWSELSLSDTAIGADEGLVVSLTLTNTGARPGWEVVQVYVHGPGRAVFRPEQELRGFAKIRLRPGEATRVDVGLDRRAFTHWDVAAHDWAVEPGRYEIRVGASSRDIRLTAMVTVGGAAARRRAARGPGAPDDAYWHPAPGRFDRDAFAAIYGRPLPPDVPDAPGRYTLGTPLAEMASPAAGLLQRVIRRRAMELAGGDATPVGQLAARAIDDMSLRSLRMFTRGAVDGRMLSGLLLVANGRYGPGVRTLLRAAWAGGRARRQARRALRARTRGG